MNENQEKNSNVEEKALLEEIAKMEIDNNDFTKEENNKSKKVEEKNMKEENKEQKSGIKLNIPTLSQVRKEIEKTSTVIGRYQYINEYGEVPYEIHRMKNAEEPFYVVRPIEDGQYKYGLGKVKTIPYNLPNVIKAKEEGEVIIVTEGESKADVFNELGFTATTVPFKGANKWNNRYNKYIKYAKVLIIADNDDKSREFASLTFETISDVTDNIGILELSEIYPNLKEGGDIEDLREIVGNDEQLKEVLNQIIEDFTSTEEDTKEVE